MVLYWCDNIITATWAMLMTLGYPGTRPKAGQCWPSIGLILQPSTGYWLMLVVICKVNVVLASSHMKAGLGDWLLIDDAI